MQGIEVDLAGLSWRILGDDNRFTKALAEAFAQSGARPTDEGRGPDFLLVSSPLVAASTPDQHVLEKALGEGRRMAAGEGGRIVFLLSAAAGLPMKAHLSHSAQSAALLAGVRVLAMELAPRVLVNAVGVGLIQSGEEAVAGDPRMLSHVSLGRAGTIDDVVAAVLFLCDPANTYTTGQILNVDGGWTVGYGRNF